MGSRVVVKEMRRACGLKPTNLEAAVTESDGKVAGVGEEEVIILAGLGFSGDVLEERLIPLGGVSVLITPLPLGDVGSLESFEFVVGDCADWVSLATSFFQFLSRDLASVPSSSELQLLRSEFNATPMPVLEDL